MSTLNALRVLTADVHIPPSGAWWADVTLDSSALPAVGAATLTLGDLTMSGQVIRTDFDDNPRGAKPYAVVRGGAGWRKPVAMAGTYSGGPVRLSTVLRDLATMNGETIVQPADVVIGNAYAWQAHAPQAPVHYEDILADLVSRGALSTWRVDPTTGATRFDAWPSIGAADGRGRVTGRNLSRNHRHVGLDVSVAAFLPGATIEGATVSRVMLHEDAGKLSADVYLDGSITAHQSIRRVMVALFPWLPDVALVAGAAGKGLAIRAAGGLLHLAGGPSDPGVLRVGDGGRLAFDPGVPGTFTPALYYSPNASAVYKTVTLLTPGSTSGGTVPTLPGITAGTSVAPSGSQKVTCA